MAHLAPAYANNGSSGGSYYETLQQQLPPHLQQQQQRSMAGAAPPSQQPHYSLGPYEQVNMQQPQSLSHKQASPAPSPYRQGQQLQTMQQSHTQIHAPPHQSPHTQMHLQQQQPPHMMHQHPTRPISSSGASFKRELFPHEMAQQQQQQQQPPHRQSSFAGLAGVPGSKDGANISPPPGSDEFYFHEANVRSLTESPSPPLPLQQNHPPEQVAHMLSQIIKKQQAALGGPPQGQGQSMTPQQHSSQHQQMLAQQQAAQQQAQRAELYNHFQSAGYKPAGLHPQQQQQQNHYASPAASIQLSQSQAHSAHSQLASHYNSRAPSDAMRPPQQQSYYDQPPPQAQHGAYSTHMHQQPQQPQQQQLQSSPYGSALHSKPGLSAAQQSQQHSPSQIPGMSNVVDPEYIRMLKRRQAELIEMQQQEQLRAAQMRLQQQQQPMQHGGGGGGMQMRLDSQLDHHHSQQSFAAPSLSAPVHDPYAAQAPPPLQGRSQSLPAADQYGQIHSSVPTAHGYYSEQTLQQQYRSEGYAQLPQQQQQPLGGMPLQHAYSNNGASVLPPHLQQQQPLHMHSQQQQQLPYSTAGSVAPPGGLGFGSSVAGPPGFKAGEGPSSGNSPPQQGRQQQYQQQQQQQQQPSRYEQMQQLKQIVGTVNSSGSDADFRSGAASPNFGNTPINSNVASVHYPPPSGGGGSATGRVPTAPYPRRSQSLGDPNGNMSGMGVGAPPPPVSHEAVPISLGGRRGAAAAGGAAEGTEAGERGRVVAAANLSRFSAGPPNQDSRGFVARCCTEARRGGRGGNHLSPSAANSVSSSAAPAGSAGSSVLTRASFGTRRTSKDYTQLSGGPGSYVPLNQYNPFSNLSSSPDLDSSPSPSNANNGDRPSAATWGPRDGGASKPAPLSMSSASGSGGSGQTTPCQSPTTKQHPAPRARMHTPLLPPTPK